MKELRNVGFSKTYLEKDIQSEMQIILQQIHNRNVGVNPSTLLSPAVMNVLWKYVAGIMCYNIIEPVADLHIVYHICALFLVPLFSI